MKKITLLAFLLSFSFFNSQAQTVTLVDTFAFEWTNNFNSFWGITDVNGQLHLGSDGPGDIFIIDNNANITSTIMTEAQVNFNHGMVWDGGSYWVAEDFTTGGASLFNIDQGGLVKSSFVLPPLVGGNTSGVGGLSLDTDGIWFSVYYPDFDVFPFGHAYKVDTATQAILDTIPLYGQQVYGIANHQNFLFYVTDDLNGDEERIYAYDKTLGDTLFSFPLLDPDGDSSPRGLHWFDDHLWLLAKRPGGSAFAYTMLYKYKIDIAAPLIPEISVTNDTLNFGVVPVADPMTLDFYIKNIGTASLDVSDISINNSTDFSFTPSPPFSIVEGDSLAISVTFNPMSNLTFNDTLTITSNAATMPIQFVHLIGEGIIVDATQNIDNQSVVNIFPNPTQDILNVKFSSLNPSSLHISLSNLEGKQILNLYESQQKIMEKHFQFDVSDIVKGSYFLSIKKDGQVWKTIPLIVN